MKHLYKREYLGEWAVMSQEYQEAYKLWLDYCYHCELYDSKICSKIDRDGFYMPLTNEQRRSSMTYAHNKFNEIKAKRNIYIDDNTWRSAKGKVIRYNFKKLEQEYNHYFTKGK